MFVTILAINSWPWHYVDFVSAFLHGNLNKEIHLKVPDRVVVKRKERWYWWLKKVLYKLKQAGRQ
jgi:hypothetical protein